jgi:hypothetical protein
MHPQHVTIKLASSPSRECISSRQIELVAFLNKSLSIAPFVNAVTEVGVKNLLSYDTRKN